MGTMVVRDKHDGNRLTVAYPNGKIAQALRHYPPTRYEVVSINAMNPLGAASCEHTAVMERTSTTEGGERGEFLSLVAIIMLIIVLMGVAGGIEQGLIPLP